MARKGGGSAQRQPLHPIPNGNPPPSTIAAQIVSNAANIRGQQEPGSKVAFAELLKEFLKDPSTDEPNSQLNAQFISVVAEAGLNALLQNNVFAPDLLIPQAIDSISAIKLTIQRRPHLLLSTRAEEDDGNPRPPLFLWLFPILIGLLGQPNFGAIQEHLQGLLSTCIGVFSQTSRLWHHAITLVQLYRSCVESMYTQYCSREIPANLPQGILLSLEASENMLQTLGSQCSTIIPPSSSIGEFWPDSHKLVALPQGCQKTITSRPQAILIGFHIVQSILDHSRCKVPEQRTVTPFLSDNDLPWALDSCFSLWQNFAKRSSRMEKGRLHDEVEIAFMQVLEIAALPREVLQWSLKVSISLSTCTSGLVQSCSTSPFSETNQIRLASLLIRLRGSLEELSNHNETSTIRRRDLKNAIIDNMAPSVLNICQDMTKFAPLQKDLQVWTLPTFRIPIPY